MFTNLHGATKALFFYLIAIALSTLFSLLSVAWDQSFWIGIPTMLTPTVAVLVMLLVITRDGYSGAGWRSLGVHRFGWRAWPLAFLAPLLLLVSSYTITWLLGVAQWRGDFGGSIGQWAIKLAIQITVITLAALGEEIGWRGYLLPKLLPLGMVRAALLGGFLHGLWHLPLLLLTPFYHGDGNRFIVVPLFLLTLTAAGIFYSYLRLTSNSVWPAALAHGTFNTIWGALAALTVPTSALWMEYLSGESGVITLILLIMIVIVLLRRLAAPQAVTNSSEEQVRLAIA